jgi:hypothetical protein
MSRWIAQRTIITASGVSGSLLLLALVPAVVLGASLTETFKAQGDVANGNIVSLDDQAKAVARSNSSNAGNIYGVIVSTGDVNFIQNKNTGVQVATSGVVDTFASTLNGPINEGDPITVTNVEGVGEKALGRSKIVGIAQGHLDSTTANTQDVKLKDDPANRTVKVGLIPVKIEVGIYNPDNGLINGSLGDGASRNPLEQVADGVAGKSVKTVTLIAATLILMVSVFSSIFLVLSSSYASMLSIGRNPLSERTIFRTLMRLVLISIVIFSLGIGLAYITLKLF